MTTWSIVVRHREREREDEDDDRANSGRTKVAHRRFCSRGAVRGSPLPLVSQQSAGASGRLVGVAVRDTHHFLIASSFSVSDSVQWTTDTGQQRTRGFAGNSVMRSRVLSFDSKDRLCIRGYNCIHLLYYEVELVLLIAMGSPVCSMLTANDGID